MRAKIVSVSVWSEEDKKVAQVFYSNGNRKRFYSSYTQSWPKTVTDFVDNHEAEKVNSQVAEYK